LNGTTSANPAAVARDVRDSGEARLMMSEARRGTAVRHTATSPETAHKGSFALGPLQGGTVRKACDSDSLSVRACSRLPRRPGKRALPLLLTGSSPAFGAETHRVECCNGRTGGNRGMHARGPHHAARESDALARQELARPSSTTRAVQWPSGPPAGRGDHLRAPALVRTVRSHLSPLGARWAGYGITRMGRLNAAETHPRHLAANLDTKSGAT